MEESLERAISKRYHLVHRMNVDPNSNSMSWKAVRRKASDRAGEREGDVPVRLTRYLDACQNAFDALPILRELLLMQEFSEHPNIVKVMDVRKSSNNWDLFVAYSHSDMSLKEILLGPEVLDGEHHAYIVYQVACALKTLHSGNVIHRDVRPENVWVDLDSCRVRLAGFSEAMCLPRAPDKKAVSLELEGASPLVLGDYVASRACRAPELLLGASTYSGACDMWSVGCLLATLSLRRSLFSGGSQYAVFASMGDAIGPPANPQDIEAMKCPYAYAMFERVPTADAQSTVMERSSALRQKVEALGKEGLEDSILDLLARLLVYDPAQRLTVEETLSHVYLANTRQQCLKAGEEEYVCSRAAVVELSCGTHRKFAVESERDDTLAYIRSLCRKSKRGETCGITLQADLT